MEKRIRTPLYRVGEDDLERRLELEIYSDNPDESVIRECVQRGAFILGDYLYDIIQTGMNQPKGHHKREYGAVSFATVKLLVELGADVKWHEPDQCDCLLPAVWLRMPELVELLLQHGANPNLIEEGETVLDEAYIEAGYVALDCPEAYADMEKIVELIEKHGGKRAKEL